MRLISARDWDGWDSGIRASKCARGTCDNEDLVPGFVERGIAQMRRAIDLGGKGVGSSQVAIGKPFYT